MNHGQLFHAKAALDKSHRFLEQLNMKSIRGLQHETSEQAAVGHQTTFATAAIAGQKRSWSTGEDAGHRSAVLPSDTGVRFHRASSIPDAPGRIAASRVVDNESGKGLSEYSQRRMISATPTASVDPELDLAHPVYGLPDQLVHNFANMGIKQIYPWQKNCLKGPGLLAGTKNLVYCAPTGGGKSLVADCKAW